MNKNELTVIQKIYDLVLWSCNHTSKFPKSYRFVLGERIERNLYSILEDLIAAKYSKARLPILQDINLHLEILRFQIRLAKDLKCLPNKSYEYASLQILEAGKLVGAWIKKAGGAT